MGYEDSDVDEDDAKTPSHVAIQSETIGEQDERDREAEQSRDATSENTFWHELRQIHRRICAQSPMPVGKGAHESSSVQDGSEPLLAVSTPSLQLPRQRPQSAPVLVRSRSAPISPN